MSTAGKAALTYFYEMFEILNSSYKTVRTIKGTI